MAGPNTQGVDFTEINAGNQQQTDENGSSFLDGLNNWFNNWLGNIESGQNLDEAGNNTAAELLGGTPFYTMYKFLANQFNQQPGPGVEVERQLGQLWPAGKLNFYKAWLQAYYPEIYNNGNVWTEIDGKRAPYHASNFSDAYNDLVSKGWPQGSFAFNKQLQPVNSSGAVITKNPLDWTTAKQAGIDAILLFKLIIGIAVVSMLINLWKRGN